MFNVLVPANKINALSTDNFGGRIAFVDYDGKAAYENYRKNPPKSEAEEIDFVKPNATKMVQGIEVLKEYVDYLKK